ncbi:DUF805 domain-containing protein [Shinella zoogloeoides]|uniref:DUF805 domain-containing protein n=1 Tax=Shinella zoogloeoides TaxID=352475 RepID=UPI001F58F458|nr:DUF805 domain-containing protein [Shinella zoogloeoides]
MYSVARAFRGVFDYTGYSTRSEFWWFVLFSGAVNAISYPVSMQIFQALLKGGDPLGIALISIIPPLIIFLVLIVVWIPLAIRRIRDAGKSPLWMASYIPPLIFVFGAEFIKDEFQDAFLKIYVILFWVVLLFMVFIYSMPSKNERG